ncbi:CG16957 [Drosophila busckii]|uniref:CG16957 n=2 Tax=Drosophila busckii TaxID=30019 RepID=A0A0M4ERI9_DROBS|nr:membrane-associated progesterone receptor component 1 isoform X2 [Drosophila busckii]ALC39507.1 CG16957 [Drosophila busckii]ALC39516.1 CG16957 [Drosophila busckii]
MNVKELREYDGVRPDGRILVAVNFNIYDVSCAKHFYGKDGTYPHYAGCDISRNLINFSAEKNEREDFDDLSDLTTKQKSTLLEWDHQYSDRYPLVGRLLPEQEPSIDFDIEKSESEDIAALEEQFM